MAKEVSSSLGESDLLLILEMCNERIEKCDLRERQNVHERNNPAAEWDRRLRERYLLLRSEALAELERRRRTIAPGPEADRPGAARGPGDTSAG